MDLKVFITTSESTCDECGEDLGRHAWIRLVEDEGALCLSCADYERQGVLVEERALDQAEQECLADADARARRGEREAERRAELDRQYVEQFAARVRQLFPGCPPGVEIEIAEHACQKYSGRVGRSAAAKALDEQAVHLAVTAHVRHAETEYDALLAMGYERWEARETVVGPVARVLARWEAGE